MDLDGRADECSDHSDREEGLRGKTGCMNGCYWHYYSPWSIGSSHCNEGLRFTSISQGRRFSSRSTSYPSSSKQLWR